MKKVNNIKRKIISAGLAVSLIASPVTSLSCFAEKSSAFKTHKASHLILNPNVEHKPKYITETELRKRQEQSRQDKIKYEKELEKISEQRKANEIKKARIKKATQWTVATICTAIACAEAYKHREVLSSATISAGKNLAEYLKPKWTASSNFVKNTYGVISNSTKNFLSSTASHAKSAGNAIADFAGKTYNSTASHAKSAGNAIANFAGRTYNSTASHAKSAGNAIANFAGKTYNSTASHAKSAGNAIADFAGRTYNSTASHAKSAGNAIANFATRTYSSAKNWVKSTHVEKNNITILPYNSVSNTTRNFCPVPSNTTIKPINPNTTASITGVAAIAGIAAISRAEIGNTPTVEPDSHSLLSDEYSPISEVPSLEDYSRELMLETEEVADETEPAVDTVNCQNVPEEQLEGKPEEISSSTKDLNLIEDDKKVRLSSSSNSEESYEIVCDSLVQENGKYKLKNCKKIMNNN